MPLPHFSPNSAGVIAVYPFEGYLVLTDERAVPFESYIDEEGDEIENYLDAVGAIAAIDGRYISIRFSQLQEYKLN